MKTKYLLVASALLLSRAACAQDELLHELQQQQAAQPTTPEYVTATFKGTRIINGHSVENPGPGTLVFMISHRFGKLNDGAYNFFGLDQATIRLGLEYGIGQRLAIGGGRSSLEKTFDGFVKYQALRQSRGAHAMPVSLTLLTSAAVGTLHVGPSEPERNTASRMTYAYQALLARKFSESLSVQLMPTLIHRNYVLTRRDENDVRAMGVAARQKLTKRLALTGEYYYLLPGATATDFRNALGLGLDIETGGHVFQLHVTNAQGMIEKFFIPTIRGNFFGGDLYFGFNVSRAFALRRQPAGAPGE